MLVQRWSWNIHASNPTFCDGCPGRHRGVTIVGGSGLQHQAGARTAVQPCQDPAPETLPGVAGLFRYSNAGVGFNVTKNALDDGRRVI